MTEKTHDQFQLERLAFFSDAVFAIAITLLIIEVRLPETTPQTEQGIAQGLANLVPQYIGFLVSFFVIGRFWIGHHRVFGRLKRVDDALVWRNLLFLMTIAFMPFPTALVSHFVSTRVGVGAYAAWLTLAGVFNLLLERHAANGPLVAPGHLDELRRLLRTAWAPIVVGVLAFAAAMVTPHLALVPMLGSPVITGLLARRRKPAVSVAEQAPGAGPAAPRRSARSR